MSLPVWKPRIQRMNNPRYQNKNSAPIGALFYCGKLLNDSVETCSNDNECDNDSETTFV